MISFKNKNVNYEKVIEEIHIRQSAPWNNGRINSYNLFPHIRQFFKYINSGVNVEDYFYKGDIFRLHSGYVNHNSRVDFSKEEIVGKICSDGSCFILPHTEYTNNMVAFSKSPDYTDNHIYNKVFNSEQAKLLHFNTGNMWGIDVNKFLNSFGYETRYEGEQEVLFPLSERFLVKEYRGTLNQFRYYLKKYC